MQEYFKCFSIKILDYYNITVNSLLCNKLSESKMHDATITIILVYFRNEITRLTKKRHAEDMQFLDQTAQKGNVAQTN